MKEQVMVYEIKSSAAANAKQLFSSDGNFFYWNDSSFRKLQEGDFVFVVNTTDKWVLFTKFINDRIPTEMDKKNLISRFTHRGEKFNPVAPTLQKLEYWKNFIHLKIFLKLNCPKNWNWKSFGNPENTYLNGPRINLDTSANRIRNIDDLLNLSKDEKYSEVLKVCRKNFENSENGKMISSIKYDSNSIMENDQKIYKKILDGVYNYILNKGFNYSYEDIANFFLSLKTKPFVILAGISGTGKTQLPRKFAEAIGMDKEMQIIQVPVRPDWTDSSDLIGYTALDGKFVHKPLTEAILRAKNDPDKKPYFFILDEMNLARVEHYFSDFLSIIETREIEDGEIITDVILRDEVLKTDKDKQLYGNLRWPQNLFLIGTVNMDETTHAFSRKVLDRANSIEMNSIDLDWINHSSSAINSLKNVSSDFFNPEYIESKQLTKEDQNSIKDEMKILQDINKVLKKADLHFAYRVRDEVAFYLILNKKYSIMEADTALDFQLMQKVLPRIHGSSRRVYQVLLGLLETLTAKKFTNSEFEISEIYKEVGEISKTKQPKSVEKILFMLERFDEDRFTSFWV